MSIFIQPFQQLTIITASQPIEETSVKIKEIMEFPWVLVSCGAWAILAIYREQKVRYLKWRYRQIKRERDHFKSLLEDKNKHS